MTYEELKENCQAFGLTLSDEMLSQLKTFSSLLHSWNEMINLTSITEDPEVVEKHFFDSLLPAKYFDFSNKKIADVGTGGGFPGLVLAICFPTSKITLIDSTSKKFKFLEEVVSQTGIKNVTMLNGRVEELTKLRESFDVVTARAFAALPVIIETCVPLLKVNGTLVAMKASKGEEEVAISKIALQRLESTIDQKGVDVLPESKERRLNYFIRKCQKTSIKYPRPWAKIVSKPL